MLHLSSSRQILVGYLKHNTVRFLPRPFEGVITISFSLGNVLPSAS
jgi:hypothetical protein